MTDRLYYTDAYLAVFDGQVVDRAEEGRRLYLDRTAFYPTSGGQPFDTGTLGGVRVVDVVDEGDRIAHMLADPLLTDRVTGEIDWQRRFDHMQQHTGQHLVSAVFMEHFGLATVSVHFGPLSSTLDLDVEAVDPPTIREAERLANDLVVQNRAVAVSFEEATQAIGLRKALAREGPLRIVTIEGLDRSACGGTHVRATGEVGTVLLRRAEKVRRTMRVEFVCGRRALRAARSDFENLTRAAAALSAAADDVPMLVQRQVDQLRELEGERRRTDKELAVHRARELYDRASPDATGIRRVLVRRGSGGTHDLRSLAQAFVALPSALFVGAIVSPPSLLLATSADSGLDAGKLLKEHLVESGGRGGGSARLAQGSLPNEQALDVVVRQLTL